MKNFITFLFFFLFMFSFSQERERMSKEQYRAAQKLFILEKLNLDPESEKQFTSIYFETQEKIFDKMVSYRKIKRDLYKNDSADSNECNSLIKKMYDIKRDELDKTRPFVFIALGGSSNGSTLEGHNYTYVGSTWGRIIEGIIDSKIMNPIIYIDELDKISRTEHGKEIIGILTHLTDPSQNTEFTDKYFSGIKFDISKCLIIFSYNDPALIDKILLDRIQRIRINPLNKVDKVMVAKKHIIPEILHNVGMSEDDIVLDDNELMYLIDTYTYEAGARKLKEKLYEIYREINLQYLTDSNDFLPFTISKDFIDKVFENYDKVDIKLIHNSQITKSW